MIAGIGVGDGGRQWGHVPPSPPPKKNGGGDFSGNYYVKFGYFRLFGQTPCKIREFC